MQIGRVAYAAAGGGRRVGTGIEEQPKGRPLSGSRGRDRFAPALISLALDEVDATSCVGVSGYAGVLRDVAIVTGDSLPTDRARFVARGDIRWLPIRRSPSRQRDRPS